ncbi:hypothetical protein ABZW18_03670 [Streptomyces sp. NPDC004647]|uniref:hypothetical protein n=1 Tax=Streptomyces sp. NPDC004647 TaxID=3154671 RepID=UPI0033B2E561
MPINRKTSILIASIACGALLCVSGGAAVAAADNAPARSADVKAALKAPVPNSEALERQNEALGELNGALQPVHELLSAVLKAPDGKLSATEAARHANAAKKALEELKAAAPQSADGVNGSAGSNQATEQAQQLQVKTIEDLLAAINALLAAIATGDPAAIAAALQDVIDAVTDLIIGTVVGGGLPAPSLSVLQNPPAVSSTSQSSTVQSESPAAFMQ